MEMSRDVVLSEMKAVH